MGTKSLICSFITLIVLEQQQRSTTLLLFVFRIRASILRKRKFDLFEYNEIAQIMTRFFAGVRCAVQHDDASS